MFIKSFISMVPGWPMFWPGAYSRGNTSKYRPSVVMLVRYKRFSLFVVLISDEGKKVFITSTTDHHDDGFGGSRPVPGNVGDRC
jgi:hypothetical protein